MQLEPAEILSVGTALVAVILALWPIVVGNFKHQKKRNDEFEQEEKKRVARYQDKVDEQQATISKLADRVIEQDTIMREVMAGQGKFEEAVLRVTDKALETLTESGRCKIKDCLDHDGRLPVVGRK